MADSVAHRPHTEGSDGVGRMLHRDDGPGCGSWVVWTSGAVQASTTSRVTCCGGNEPKGLSTVYFPPIERGFAKQHVFRARGRLRRMKHTQKRPSSPRSRLTASTGPGIFAHRNNREGGPDTAAAGIFRCPLHMASVFRVLAMSSARRTSRCCECAPGFPARESGSQTYPLLFHQPTRR